MRVRVNGEDQQFTSLTTVAALIAQRKLRPEMVVVEYNGLILARDQWGAVGLKDGDVLEVLSFVGGGSRWMMG